MTICNKPWCGKCTCQPTNPSNRTVIVPQEGSSAYEAFLAYNPDLDPSLNPDSPWTEDYWLNNYVKGQKGDTGDVYIPNPDTGTYWLNGEDTGIPIGESEISPETDEDIFE